MMLVSGKGLLLCPKMIRDGHFILLKRTSYSYETNNNKSKQMGFKQRFKSSLYRLLNIGQRRYSLHSLQITFKYIFCLSLPFSSFPSTYRNLRS